LGPLAAREAEINRHMAIVHWYQAWGSTPVNSSKFDPELFRAVRAHGSLPFLTWEPRDLTLPTNQKTFPLRSIAAGVFDAYIDSWAVGIRDYQHPVLLAFAHEMNGDWYPWGAGVNGNMPSDYVAAYRHVHDRFAQQGARNVAWVWAPAADLRSSYPAFKAFYPGDAYVDWLGVDVYNNGATESWSSWQPLSQLLQSPYAQLTALSASKPMVLAEWASVEQGGNKGAWIREAGVAIPQLFARIRAVVWFSETGTQYALNSSVGAIAGARAAFGSPPYCATPPY
jgi:hypothetical protein